MPPLIRRIANLETIMAIKVGVIGAGGMLQYRAAGLCDAAVAATRLPAGHPEAFIEAFGNLYAAVTEAILNGETTGDFPTAVDGAAGVAFIHACVTSSEKGHAWCGV